jgi:hypothetical protein
MDMESGHGRANNSFVLSRVLQDLESEYAPTVGNLNIEILDVGNPKRTLSLTQSIEHKWCTVAIMAMQLAIGIHAFVSHGDE